MRVNARAILQVAGISCLHDEGGGPPLPARVALVTEETVKAARHLSVSDPSLRATESSPGLRYGGALAYVGGGAGPARQVVLSPGEAAPFRLTDGTFFLGPHMLEAERRLPPSGSGDGAFLGSLIRSVFRLVAAAPDPDRFPWGLIAQSYRFSLRSAFGEAALPIADTALVTRAKAELIRGRIAAIDPKHPDALGAAAPLARLLDRAGIDSRSDGVPVSGLGRVTRSGARSLSRTEPYRDGLFGPLTRTPVDRIEGVVLPVAEIGAIDRSLQGSRLSGDWADGARALAEGLTRSGTSGYRSSLTLYAADGLDLMVLSDTIGDLNGLALLFSWPTHERAPVLRTATGPVYAICPEETPSDNEVTRLDRVLAALLEAADPGAGPRQALDA